MVNLTVCYFIFLYISIIDRNVRKIFVCEKKGYTVVVEYDEDLGYPSKISVLSDNEEYLPHEHWVHCVSIPGVSHSNPCTVETHTRYHEQYSVCKDGIGPIYDRFGADYGTYSMKISIRFFVCGFSFVCHMRLQTRNTL